MKERPILFSAPMVRAILDGRKTQTRRVMKPAFGKNHPIMNLREHGLTGEDCSGLFNDPASWGYPFAEDGNDISLDIWPTLCPYGVPAGHDRHNVYGSRLWVRETWNVFAFSNDGDEHWPIKHIPKKDPREIEERRQHIEVDYSATSDATGPWRPSIHMPRWASRINLDVMDVRAERLQDINEEDALAEGASKIADLWTHTGQYTNAFTTARDSFKSLWKEINGVESWMENPWVWVVTFKRLSVDANPATL